MGSLLLAEKCFVSSRSMLGEFSHLREGVFNITHRINIGCIYLDLPSFTKKTQKMCVNIRTVRPMDFMGNEKRVTGFRGQRKPLETREAQYEEQVEQLKIDLELRRKAPKQLKAPIKRNARPQKKFK